MQSQGLLHLAEQIFDNVSIETIMESVNVCRTWNVFLGKYARKRLILKLDSVLARNRYVTNEDFPGSRKNFLQVFHCWKELCDYMKHEANISTLVKFINKIGKIFFGFLYKYQFSFYLQINTSNSEFSPLKSRKSFRSTYLNQH